MFTVDGLIWSIPCDISRSIRVEDSDISGKMLNNVYFHDVTGTYFDYEVTLTPNPHQMGEYYSLVEILAKPVDGHQFVLPYNGETVQLTAKVDNPQDVWVRMPGGGVYWKGMKFTARANHPTYEPTLAGAIRRGITPVPDVEAPSIGDTYTFTANGWEQVSGYADADTTGY